jgi:phytoene desaturase
MRVGVVGAGLGGLASAAHLLADGHQVTVFERSDGPGGRATSVVEEGFRLDLGPTVFTMPDLIGAAFEALGTSLEREVVISPLDPMYRAVFADGSEFLVRPGRDAMAAEIREFAGPREAANFEAFADWLTELYEIEMPHLIDTQWDSFRSIRAKWRPLLRLVRKSGLRHLDQAVASYLEEPRLQRVFSFQSLYAGLTPHEALSMHAITTYMDTIAGVYEVRGGASAITDALARRIASRGGEFVYGRAITRIRRNGDGAVSGIEIDGGERVDLDAVVCNVDLPLAYQTLLDVRSPRAARHGRFAPSCVVWSAGVRGAVPTAVEHHNLHFGWEWDESLKALRTGHRMSDPCTLVSVPSANDPTAAPEGGTTLFALEPVPNLRGRVDWSSESASHAAALRARLGEFGYPVDDVVTEQFIDPLIWRSLGLERGTPFSLAQTLHQTGPFRPANVDARIPGLVFVGGGTVPGVGVPMVMLSGKLAAQRVRQYAEATRTVRW